MGRYLLAVVMLAIALAAAPLGAQPPPPRGDMPRASAARDTAELLQRAERAIGVRVQQVTRSGARTEPTQDGRSFALAWAPAGTSPSGWIVTLHGHAAWAHVGITLWQPFAQRRNLGVVALQWWFGGGELPQDYYSPPELRRELERTLQTLGAPRDKVLVHGFSRGAANLYALAAVDAASPQRLFANYLANAGGASPGYPFNRDVEAGRFGASPYAGTRWWLWCGGRDPHPDRDGCPAMRRTRAWVERFGGQAELAEDPAGDHGGFHRNAPNVEAALDHFFPKR